MKHRLPFSAALASVLLFAPGCFNMEHSRIGDTDAEHLYVSNYGWYLFGCIPIACGNASPDPFLPSVFFRDDVTMEKIQTRFMQCAEDLHRHDMGDLAYTDAGTILFQIPGSEFPLPVPYLITYKKIMLSGVVK